MSTAPVSNGAEDDDDDDEDAAPAPAAGAEPRASLETVRRDKPKVGRNDPCHCGSGKKYKNCHMREDQAAGA